MAHQLQTDHDFLLLRLWPWLNDLYICVDSFEWYSENAEPTFKQKLKSLGQGFQKLEYFYIVGE